MSQCNSRNISTIRNLAMLRFKDFFNSDMTLRRPAHIFQGRREQENIKCESEL